MSVNCDVGPVRPCILARWKFGFLTRDKGGQPAVKCGLGGPAKSSRDTDSCIGGFAEEMREGNRPMMADR